MRCRILHESPGRIRVHLMQSRMTLAQADRLEYYLRAQSCVKDATVFDRTCDAVIRFQGPREDVIAALGHFSWADPALAELVPEHTGRALQREFEDRLAGLVMRRYLRKLLVPAPIRHVLTVFRAFPFLREGIALLFRGKIQVPLLDAVAIGASLLQGDYETAGSVMFLLKVGAILEEWTYRKSVNDLARTMSLQVDKVWRLGPEGEELVPVGDVAVGDTVIVRTGSMIPLDGKVSAGEAMVNQSSMTGESLPVRKTEGSYVYAGTVVEEGECALRVEKATGSGRYDRIVRMIEESEKLKSETESKAAHLADSLVPYSLGGTALAYLLTRNVTRAMSVLMVDFSCALKLSMPIAVLSAMRECGTHGITVKGGKFLEAAAESTTIVFDKTGTLTHARPRVAEVVPFGERDEAECLRLAACLEEHYPHPMANAVVEEAERRGLRHEERHSRVEYVVAHGISSRVDEQKVIIGSYHFVFEDEGVTQSPEETQKLESLRTDCSHLYLAMDGALAAVILVEDPLRSEAPAVVRQLHDLGVSRVVMIMIIGWRNQSRIRLISLPNDKFGSE